MTFPTTLLNARQMMTALVTIAAFLQFGADSCSALDVLRIEEHWELEVGGPEDGRCAPQVTMVMSPTGNVAGNFYIFSLNHWSYPDFAPGGLEVQRWNGDDWVSSHHGPSNESLHHDGETVSWVQRLDLTGSTLTFEIRDGLSETWGGFGGQGALKVSSNSTLTQLNSYLPAISLGESGIGYAGNRVSSLTLTKLVWWTSDGEMHEMVAPIDIDSDIDP